jgi:hypothetical protein
MLLRRIRRGKGRIAEELIERACKTGTYQAMMLNKKVLKSLLKAMEQAPIKFVGDREKPSAPQECARNDFEPLKHSLPSAFRENMIKKRILGMSRSLRLIQDSPGGPAPIRDE